MPTRIPKLLTAAFILRADKDHAARGRRNLKLQYGCCVIAARGDG